MHTFIKMVIAVSVLVLVGCGGGGGSSVSSGLPYVGNSAKAELNEGNSQNFLEMLQSSFANLSEDFDDEFIASGRVEQIHSKVITATKSSIVSKSNKAVKSETIQGAKSGTAKVTVEQTSALTAVVTYVFSNFDNNENLYMDGTLIVKVTLDSDGDTKDQTIIFKLLTIKSGTENAMIDGSIQWTLSDTGKRTVENYTIKDAKSTRMYKYDNFVTMRDGYNHILSYEGKVFDSEYGYVDVETLAELEYSEDGKRKPAGEVKITGENSQALIRYAYEGRVRVELDSDKDGEIDSVVIYKRDDSGEFTMVPNAAPVVEITFPRSIYTDTDMSTVSVHVYDPDLDEFTVSYEWKISGVVKGNTIALNNALFKKHNILKLTVEATDDRVDDIKTSTQSKEQEVLNSAPKIVLELDKTTVEVGDRIVLDASKSYDVDGDNFTYSWTVQDRAYNIYNEAYDIGEKYLDINESNKSKVIFNAEDVNYNYIGYGEVLPYGIEVEVDDMDTNGTSKTKSADIYIEVMDIFNTKVTKLEGQNVNLYSTSTMAVGDLNKDGLKDIVIAAQDGEQDAELIILHQDGAQAFNIIRIIKLDDIGFGEVTSLDINDFNSDGEMDIAYSSNRLQDFKVLYQNKGDFSNRKGYATNTFAYVSFPTEPDMVEYLSNSVAFLASADMNNDGKVDIATIGFNRMAGSSTGMNIFLQENGLIDSKMLALDNRTIEDNGNYEVTDSHKARHINISDVDSDGLQDLIVANYIEYQESNGSYTEKFYDDSIDALAFIDLNNDKNKEMIAIKEFEQELVIYNSENNDREYIKGKILDIYDNPFQIESTDVNGDKKEDIILGHNAMGFFSLLVQNKNGFYGSQLYFLDESIGHLYHKKVIWLEDMDNNGDKDILFLGEYGFEVFFRK